MSSEMFVCRLCGRGVSQCPGWLERVNGKGVPGMFECRPSCNSSNVLSRDDAVIGAINAAAHPNRFIPPKNN